MSTFFERSTEDQIADLTGFASELLRENNFSQFSIESVNYEFNATFAVTASNSEKFALRININSTRTVENTQAEIAWARELSQKLNTSNSPFRVAEPASFGATGEFVVQKFHAGIGKNLTCVLYRWCEGEEVGDEPSDEQVQAMGAAMATLHDLSLTSASHESNGSRESRLPRLSDPFWETEDFLFSSKSRLTSQERSILEPVFTEICNEIAGLYTTHTSHIIHADMHGWNLLWNNGEMSIIDFDDCGIGLAIQDISVALYYFDTPEQDALFLKGYTSIRELPDYSDTQMSALLLHRRFMLLNYLCETNNTEHQEMLPDYLAATIERAQNYPDTYRPISRI